MKRIPLTNSNLFALVDEYQDKRFGKRMRLHNPTKDGWRCTVCNRVEKK